MTAIFAEVAAGPDGQMRIVNAKCTKEPRTGRLVGRDICDRLASANFWLVG